MVDTRKASNECGGECDVKSGVMMPKVDSVKENGNDMDIETSSSSLRDDGTVTYERRKSGKASELMNELNDMPSSSNDCPLKHPRNIVLEQICESLENEGGLKKCIQSGIVFHPGSGSRCTAKESSHSYEDGSKCTLQARGGPKKVAKENSSMTSNGLEKNLSCNTVTDLCGSTLAHIIMSESFTQLCSLIVENFQGMRAENLFDLSRINSRMKENAYESSPEQFHLDIQQIWTKLQNVGTDIVTLAKCLSDKTTSSFREQFPIQEANTHITTELKEAFLLEGAHMCTRCSQKADGKNGLVCDSCEEMYHLSCVEPTIKEIPTHSWYCTNCTAKGVESPHENCVTCERLNKPFQDEFFYEELGESLTSELVKEEGGQSQSQLFPDCSICRTEVKTEEYMTCGHSFCPHKFYHTKCLNTKQLISYGPCWYCPSCLCRNCFTDQDDDKIVLCDGCDHAYHIYCMDPPQNDIPKGKWFCKKCDAGIQRVLEAKRSYNKSRKRGLDGKMKVKERLSKSGGVDMLLNAAKTLELKN